MFGKVEVYGRFSSHIVIFNIIQNNSCDLSQFRYSINLYKAFSKLYHI